MWSVALQVLSQSSPAIAFVLLSLAYSRVFRSAQARASCALMPPKLMRQWGWVPVFLLNAFIVVWFLVTGMGFGVAYSIIQIVQDVETFHVFAECYQCQAKGAVSNSG